MSLNSDTIQDAEMVENPESSETEQVVLINGAASGIGLVTALAFAARDFRLALLDHETDRLALVAKKCHEKSPKGYKPLEMSTDLATGGEIASKSVIEAVITQLGRLDVLINNISHRTQTKFDEPDCIDSYHKIMDKNVHSVVYMSLAAFEWLKRSRGSIVNVSSALDDRPSKHMFGYCMSKVSITMLTKCLAGDFAPFVRVNCVSSGPIAATILDDIGIASASSGTQASRAPGKPEEVAKMIIYLASKDKSACITGSRVLLDSSLSVSSEL